MLAVHWKTGRSTARCPNPHWHGSRLLCCVLCVCFLQLWCACDLLLLARGVILFVYLRGQTGAGLDLMQATSVTHCHQVRLPAWLPVHACLLQRGGGCACWFMLSAISGPFAPTHSAACVPQPVLDCCTVTVWAIAPPPYGKVPTVGMRPLLCVQKVVHVSHTQQPLAQQPFLCHAQGVVSAADVCLRSCCACLCRPAR
jgi:hypothetical protein